MGGGIKVIILRGMREGGKSQRENTVSMGELTPLYVMKRSLTM